MSSEEQLEKINKKIRVLTEQVDTRISFEKHLGYLKSKKEELNTSIHRLHAIVDKERQEYEILETENLENLFMKVLGFHKTKYEKERQEFVEASLKYNSAIDRFILIDFEIEIVEKKLFQILDMQKSLDTLLLEKQAYFQKHDFSKARKVGQFDLDIHNNQRKINISRKLISEGQRINLNIKSIEKALDEVSKWLNTKGVFSKPLPFELKRKLRKASKDCVKTQNSIDAFQGPLNDVLPSSQLSKHILDNHINHLFQNLIQL